MVEKSVKGQKDLQTESSSFNSTSFQIKQEIIDLNTCTIVKVIAVTPSEEDMGIGTVDIKPLVSQMTGNNEPQEHGTIYGIPYTRAQGGVNAIIIDPEVGDLGMCLFCDRDITRVKATKDAALPGSKRVMSMSDGLYVGGLLNAVPTRYIKFDSEGDGIEIIGVEKVKITGENIELTADTDITITAPEVNVIADTKAVVDSPLIELGENPIQQVVLSGDLCPLGLGHIGTASIKGTQT